jgi:hypothetical protein
LVVEYTCPVALHDSILASNSDVLAERPDRNAVGAVALEVLDEHVGAVGLEAKGADMDLRESFGLIRDSIVSCIRLK